MDLDEIKFGCCCEQNEKIGDNKDDEDEFEVENEKFDAEQVDENNDA